MKNLKVYLPLVDGGSFPLDFNSGKELIQEFISDDFGVPPSSLVFEANTKEGKIIRISIPYSEDDRVSIHIDSKP